MKSCNYQPFSTIQLDNQCLPNSRFKWDLRIYKLNISILMTGKLLAHNPEILDRMPGFQQNFVKLVQKAGIMNEGKVY